MPIEKLRVRGWIDFLVAVRCLVGEWLSLVEHLVRDQGVGGSNPLSPTNLSLSLFQSFTWLLRLRLFRYISVHSVQLGVLEPKATSFRPLPPECNVLFDLVVEVAHVLSSMAHPVLV
jgi:hypothetical protein